MSSLGRHGRVSVPISLADGWNYPIPVNILVVLRDYDRRFDILVGTPDVSSGEHSKWRDRSQL